MEVLHGKEAISYLDRIQSCLHPKEDNFGSIPLIYNLINLEKTFLRRLDAKGLTKLPLPIGDHGFPELSALKVDIGKAFGEVDNAIANRAYALDRVFQETINANAEGVEKRSYELEESFSKDFELMTEINNLTLEQKEFLTEGWDTSSDSRFPLFTDTKYPGLMFSRKDKSPFINRRGTRKKFKGQNFRPGFKFIDFNNSEHDLPSAILMVAFNSSRQALGFRFLTSDRPLVNQNNILQQKVQIEGSDYSAQLEYHELDLNEIKISREDFLLGENLARCIHKLEFELLDLYPNILAGMYETDITGKSSPVLYSYFHSLLKINDLVDKMTDFSQKTLSAIAIDPEFAGKTVLDIKQQIQEVYESVQDNDLRKSLQLSVAKQLNPVRKNIDELRSGLPSIKQDIIKNVLTVPQPRGKSFWKNLLRK